TPVEDAYGDMWSADDEKPDESPFPGWARAAMIGGLALDGDFFSSESRAGGNRGGHDGGWGRVIQVGQVFRRHNRLAQIRHQPRQIGVAALARAKRLHKNRVQPFTIRAVQIARQFRLRHARRPAPVALSQSFARDLARFLYRF